MRKNKRFLVLAAMLLAVVCAATFMVGSAVAADEGVASITVKIGDAEAQTADSFAAAMLWSWSRLPMRTPSR